MNGEKQKKPEARLHAVISGRVQGVSFRYYTKMTAERLDLTGWVTNRWDGTVETIAEGSREQLNDFLSFLRQGPPTAMVQNIDADWESSRGEFSSFRVR